MPITSDTYTLIGLGVGAMVVLWLVFSVLKKVIGLMLLAAMAAAAFLLWQNRAMRDTLLAWLQGVF